MDFDGRLIIYAPWALGSVFFWGLVFRDDLREFRVVRKRFNRDRRSQTAAKELASDFALLLVAIASAVSLVNLVAGSDVPGLRGFSIAVALGGFLGAGIVKATFGRKR